MYLFMKAIGFTHLNLEGITECRIVYNHWKETTKIGNWWRNFAQSQNLQAGTQIIFEFIDATTNFFMDLFVARVHYTIVLSICKFLFRYAFEDGEEEDTLSKMGQGHMMISSEPIEISEFCPSS